MIYTQNCIAYTFNNVVGAVLDWLLPKGNDKKLIVETINSE